MKTNYLLIILVGLSITAFAFIRPRCEEPAAEIPAEEASASAPAPVPDPWDAFIEALIHVESKGDSTAVGLRNDVGVLQITPIMLEDANRILGEERYTLDDRTDRDKSIEIFNIIQNHYNPDHDMHYALKIWNSRAPISSHRAVMDKYREMYGAE